MARIQEDLRIGQTIQELGRRCEMSGVSPLKGFRVFHIDLRERERVVLPQPISLPCHCQTEYRIRPTVCPRRRSSFKLVDMADVFLDALASLDFKLCVGESVSD